MRIDESLLVVEFFLDFWIFLRGRQVFEWSFVNGWLWSIRRGIEGIFRRSISPVINIVFEHVD